MPYEITISGRHPAPYQQPPTFGEWRRQTAVATLHDARECARSLIIGRYSATAGDGHEQEWQGTNWESYAYRLSEDGGTVGPLPDGTTIEVRPVEWQWIDGQLGSPARYLREPDTVGDRELALLKGFNRTRS